MLAAVYTKLKEKGIPANIFTIGPQAQKSFPNKMTNKDISHAKGALKEQWDKYKDKLEFGVPMSFEEYVVTSDRRPGQPSSATAIWTKGFRAAKNARGVCIEPRCHSAPVDGRLHCGPCAIEHNKRCHVKARDYSYHCIQKIYLKIIARMPDTVLKPYRIISLNNPHRPKIITLIIAEGRKAVGDLSVHRDGNGTRQYVGIANENNLQNRMLWHRTERTMGTLDFKMNCILLPSMYLAAAAEVMMAMDLVMDMNRDGKIICINKVSALGKMGCTTDDKKVEPAYIYLLQIIPN